MAARCAAPLNAASRMATGGAPRLVDPARPRRWRARASLAASSGPKKKQCKTKRAPRRRRATGQARHPARFAIGVGVLPRRANLSRFATRRRYPPITQAMSNNGQFRRFLPAEIEPCGKVAESIFRKTPGDFYINSVMPLPSKWRTDSLLFLWRINIGVWGGPHRIFRWLQKQSMRNGRSITSLDMPIPSQARARPRWAGGRSFVDTIWNSIWNPNYFNARPCEYSGFSVGMPHGH